MNWEPTTTQISCYFKIWLEKNEQLNYPYPLSLMFLNILQLSMKSCKENAEPYIGALLVNNKYDRRPIRIRDDENKCPGFIAGLTVDFWNLRRRSSFNFCVMDSKSSMNVCGTPIACKSTSLALTVLTIHSPAIQSIQIMTKIRSHQVTPITYNPQTFFSFCQS